MRVIFFGTPELAVPSLAALCGQHEVAAVVCQPDRPQGRSKQPVPPPVKAWAREHGIPVTQPVKLNDGTFETWLREQAPEVCALVAYGRILKQAILVVPLHGFINVHPSLLPRHRGPSPIQTAILKGDSVTGVTIMRLDAGTDTGDILLQESAPIEPDDTSEALSHRLGVLGAELLLHALDQIAADTAVFTPQDHARATYTKLYEKADGCIDWSLAAVDIHNLVRAAIPWPVAHCAFKGETCRIHKTMVLEELAGGDADKDADGPGKEAGRDAGAPSAAPGTVTRVEKDRVVAATGQGQLAILVFQAPGKRAMPMTDFLRGHAIHVGDRFGSV